VISKKADADAGLLTASGITHFREVCSLPRGPVDYRQPGTASNFHRFQFRKVEPEVLCDEQTECLAVRQVSGMSHAITDDVWRPSSG
jgi:hypothetical protein